MNRRAHNHLTRRLVRVLAGLVLPMAMLALVGGCRSSSSSTQLQAKVYRIGFIGGGDYSNNPAGYDAWRQELRQRGYVEGRNLIIEWRWAEGKFERFPEFVAELLRLHVDLIFTATDPAALAAEHATSTVPIVFFACGDPVRQGFVASLAHPGGNLTGVTLTCVNARLRGKQMELLKELIPGASHVAVLWYPATSDKDVELAEAEVEARTLGLQMQSLQVRAPGDFEGAFEAAAREHADAMLVLTEAFMVFNRATIIELAAKYRLPTIYEGPQFTASGGLISYGPDFVDMIRRTAAHVDKILKGAKAADLPVEQPARFNLIVNLKTAQALGLTIPQSFLARADEVIQ
jgi:putative ABC transport system substrate-binding protein